MSIAFSTNISDSIFDPFVNNPDTLFIEITTMCNYRCKYCHMWATTETDQSLSTDEKLNVISDFWEMNPNGSVVLSGGETMLKLNEFFQLSRKCRELGIPCYCNTNASFINQSNIDLVLNEGPSGITISLDSHLPQIHDGVRGIKGSYDHITKVIKALLNRRGERDKEHRSRIMTNSVIFDENIGHLRDYIAFAEDMGIDGITFQMLSPTFMKSKKIDYFFRDHFFSDKIQAKACLQEIIEILEYHKIVKTSKQDLEWMQLYVDNPNFITEQVCASHHRNMMVNSYGEVLLCFSMKEITNGESLGNVRNQNLKELWTAEKAANIRPVMDQCRKNCGMLNCHRKK